MTNDEKIESMKKAWNGLKKSWLELQHTKQKHKVAISVLELLRLERLLEKYDDKR